MAARISEVEKTERDEAIKTINHQIKIEGELISLYEKTFQETDNKPLGMLFRTIMRDSQKHIEILQTAIEIIKGQDILIKDREEIKTNLKKHLELEEDSINRGDNLLKFNWLRENKGLASLIESWRDDEKRHHKFLKELSEKPFILINSNDFASVFRDETFFEDRYVRSKKYWDEKNPKP
ncbi:hypothetical protein JW865_04770 [Candidatus Bathyarchaeota archaeon]|nr:hypothetical protein [Candidatus Bathyarchaeota archaeon]